MFFHIIFCFCGLKEDSFTLMTDPTIVENTNIDLICEASNDIFMNRFLNNLDNRITDEKRKKIASISIFYLEFVKKHTRSIHHSFLKYFISSICYIIHISDSENDFKCNPELLFNFIAFGKLYELNKNMSLGTSPWYLFFMNFSITRYNAYEVLQNRSGDYDINLLQTKYPILGQKLQQSCSEGEPMDSDTGIWKNIDIKFDTSKPAGIKLIEFFKKASFERIILFFLTVKSKFYFENIGALYVENFEVDKLKQVIDEEIYDEMVTFEKYFVQSYSSMQNSKLYESTMNYISKDLIFYILDFSKTSDSIAKYSKLDISKTLASVDENFPTTFLKLFVEKENETMLSNVYSILKELINPSYHKYIPIIICLKSLCFKNAIPNSEKLLRIIIELLFFIDILNLKNREYEKSASKIKLENKYLECLKNKIIVKKIICERDFKNDPVMTKLIPKTLNLVQTVVHVQYFANDVFLDKLKEAVKTKLGEQNVEKSGSLEDILKKYFIRFMENELKDLPFQKSPIPITSNQPKTSPIHITSNKLKTSQNTLPAAKTEVKSKEKQPEITTEKKHETSEKKSSKQSTNTSERQDTKKNPSTSEEESKSQQKNKKKNEFETWKIVLIVSSGSTLVLGGCLFGYWYFVKRH